MACILLQKRKCPFPRSKNPLKIHSTALYCTTLIRNLPQNYVTFLVESPSRVLPRKPRNRRQQQKCAAGENLSTVLRNWWRTEKMSLLQKVGGKIPQSLVIVQAVKSKYPFSLKCPHHDHRYLSRQ